MVLGVWSEMVISSCRSSSFSVSPSFSVHSYMSPVAAFLFLAVFLSEVIDQGSGSFVICCVSQPLFVQFHFVILHWCCSPSGTGAILMKVSGDEVHQRN